MDDASRGGVRGHEVHVQSIQKGGRDCGYCGKWKKKKKSKIPKYIVERFIGLLDEFENYPIPSRSGFDVKPMS